MLLNVCCGEIDTFLQKKSTITQKLWLWADIVGLNQLWEVLALGSLRSFQCTQACKTNIAIGSYSFCWTRLFCYTSKEYMICTQNVPRTIKTPWHSEGAEMESLNGKKSLWNSAYQHKPTIVISGVCELNH